MRRSVIILSAVLICLAASNAAAGRIFGDIKMEGKPVPAGLMVTIAVYPPEGPEPGTAVPAPIAVDTALTDKFGSYKLNINLEGKCVLTLVYDGQPLSRDVFSYKTATRYDLVVAKKDGKLILRRK
jgi:hypothetical protein